MNKSTYKLWEVFTENASHVSKKEGTFIIEIDFIRSAGNRNTKKNTLN